MQPDHQEWTDEDLQQILKYFGRHLVGIALAYRCRSENGDFERETHYACLTAFVISVGQHWYLVTAGHNIEDWRPRMRQDRPIQIVAASLADYFGVDAIRTKPLQFNLFAQPMVHEWHQCADIDYAIIHINATLRASLAGNGILPLHINESRTNYDDFYGFGMVGFPGEFCRPEDHEDHSELVAEVKPVLIPIRHIPRSSPPNQNPVFEADVITMDDQTSMDGMSGGPIFGYRMGGDDYTQYEVVAIQSQWNGEKRILACPITLVMAKVRAVLRASSEPDC